MAHAPELHMKLDPDQAIPVGAAPSLLDAVEAFERGAGVTPETADGPAAWDEEEEDDDDFLDDDDDLDDDDEEEDLFDDDEEDLDDDDEEVFEDDDEEE